jgi:hypothetical protein
MCERRRQNRAPRDHSAKQGGGGNLIKVSNSDKISRQVHPSGREVRRYSGGTVREWTSCCATLTAPPSPTQTISARATAWCGHDGWNGGFKGGRGWVVIQKAKGRGASSCSPMLSKLSIADPRACSLLVRGKFDVPNQCTTQWGRALKH